MDCIEARCIVCGCGRAFARFHMKAVPFALIQCKECGVGRTWPAVSVEQLEPYYATRYYGAANRRFHPVFEWAVRWFRDSLARQVHRLRPPGRVLDVGCGRGLVLNWLRQHGWQVGGVELTEAAAHHARHELQLPVHVGSFLSAPLERDSWDVVIFWHVLEHMPDVNETLARVHELLKEGGVLIVAVPNFASWQAEVAGRNWFHLDIPRHFVHFSSAGLRGLLRKHGFVTGRMEHFSAEQNVYGWLQSLYNMMRFRYNLLYDLIKSQSARTAEVAQSPMQIVAMLVLLPLLLPASLLLSILEALAGRGGTVAVLARKAGVTASE